MKGTMPPDVKHYCRACGDAFTSSTRGHAHRWLVAHVREVHGFRAADACHSNCSFKATYEETNQGRMLHGEGAQR